MDERHYLKMRAKAEEEYKKNLEALDRVWHMSHPDRPAPTVKSDPQSLDTATTRIVKTVILGGSNGDRQFVLSEAVKEAMAQIPDADEISQPIILRKILDRYPEIKPRVEKDQIKAQIAGMLSRMAKGVELERVRESHGSEPAIFKRAFYNQSPSTP